ncbi:hypothetical protein BJ875DRAFT_373089 [Amylocarpus encephaloides]|uniref:Uncharacterized protein n=1 Tax=Amylocarpus encephaloides TaxID=45428 RepID=A0A9P7YLW2_9HELO|nr:hypothetical protein BJ875DRAFT_373089 [Amylocarpus encephaloides]
MYLQYTFSHACGHTATGPVLVFPGFEHYHTTPSQSNIPPTLRPVKIDLPIYCPFCLPNSSVLAEPGEGLICILTHYPYASWQPIRSGPLSSVTNADWAPSYGWSTQGYFQHMAWIPRPVGEIRIIGGTGELGRYGIEQTGVITQVNCARKERVGIEDAMAGRVGESRMAGLMSQLRAAVRSGELAGRRTRIGDNGRDHAWGCVN